MPQTETSGTPEGGQEMRHTPGRELDALIAERVMGWTRFPEQMRPTDNRTINGVLYCPPGHPYNAGSLNVVPHYSRDIGYAYEMEGKIKERGLCPQYTIALVKLLEREGWTIFDLIHASPVDRCRAALAAATDER